MEREERDRERDRPMSEGEWKCVQCNVLNYSRRVDCFNCKMLKPDPTVAVPLTQSTKMPQFRNTGDSDVSPDTTPSQFLLFRGLEPSVTEELLSKGALKLLRADDAASAASVLNTRSATVKVASTSSVASAGARQGSIRRVLLVKDKRTTDSWRYGFVEFAAVKDAQDAMARFKSLDKFTIASKPIMVSYIHAGVFVPVMTAVTKDYTFASLNNTAMRLAYWDEDAFVSELVVSSESPPSPCRKPGDTVSKKGGEGKNKKSKAEVDDVAFAKKVLPTALQTWTDRHAELHGTNPDSSSLEANPGNDSSTKKNDNVPPPHFFTDPVKHCCYLCMRQFISAAAVNNHERFSALHENNLNDAWLVAKAIEKLKKTAAVPRDPAPTNIDTTAAEYRDRAQERRAAFNQPKQPGFKLPGKGASTSTSSPDVIDPNISQAAEQNDSLPAPLSKGASLLAKMGWTAGDGLGATGTGSTTIIETDLYLAGMGLGMEGGLLGKAMEEAAIATRGDYREFAEKTREKARERFGKME